MSNTKRSQAPNQNPQIIDCTGKQCSKCGSALQPKTLSSGGTACQCPNCDKLTASKNDPCLSCHSKKIRAQIARDEKFKVGDKVKCVNNRGYEKQLTSDKTYVIDGRFNYDNGDYIAHGVTVLDDEGKVTKYYEERFEISANKTSGRRAQMEKDVPLTVKPVGVGAPPATPDKDLDKVDPIGAEGGGEVVPPSETPAPPVDDGRDRITKLLRDVEGLQSSIKEYLESSYKISLTEDELGELVTKILSAIASYVATTTTDRVTELAGDILNIPYEDKKK